MLPALIGTGQALDGQLDALNMEILNRYCEAFDITPEGRWNFSADICTPDRIQLFDGDLMELLTDMFRTLMDLKYFHEGQFSLIVPLSSGTINKAGFRGEVINMCSALGISIEVYSDAMQQVTPDPQVRGI